MFEGIATAIAAGAAVGLDNMRASAGLGVLAPASSRRRWLAALAISDALGLFLGAALGSRISASFASLASLIGVAALGGLALWAVFEHDHDEERRVLDRPLLILGIPLLLSFDNIVAGAALTALGYPIFPTVAVAAIVGGLLCVGGFLFGTQIRLPFLSPRHLGAALLTFAVAMAIVGQALGSA